MNLFEPHIEALVFVSPQPISAADIRAALAEALDTDIAIETVEEALRRLQARYRSPEYAFELVEVAGGYQFLTKGAYYHTISVLLRQTTRRRLSQAALETLAIIAYRQPVTKSEIEAIRGVHCDYALQKLLDKELVVVSGRSDGPGRPLLYATSEKFMEYLGLKSLADLPKPKDFKVEENSVGPVPDMEGPISEPSYPPSN